MPRVHTASAHEPWLLAKIGAARSIACLTHVDPDADGLGSQLGFLRAARAAGRDAFVVNDDPCPERYRWLDPEAVIGHLDDPPARARLDALGPQDIVLIFDANEPARVGRPLPAVRQRGVPVLLVDHHEAGPRCDLDGLVATRFSSSGELTFRLVEALGWPITAAVAAPLYAAMSFDTGSFRFLRNQPETLRVAATLLATGFDADPIQEALFASRPFAETKVLARVLNCLRRSDDGRVAWAVVAPSALADLDVPRDAVGETMPFVIGIEGVLAAALFKPGRAPGEWKVSLRSKAGTTIGQVATERGGGGHAHAAGMTLQGDIAAIEADIIAALERCVAAEP